MAMAAAEAEQVVARVVTSEVAFLASGNGIGLIALVWNGSMSGDVSGVLFQIPAGVLPEGGALAMEG